jgi:hypothetical protein
MSCGRFVFVVTFFSIVILGLIVITVLKWRVLLELLKDEPLTGILHASFLPLATPFRLKNDGTINPKLYRIAQLHDRLLKLLLYFTGLAILIVILVVTFQPD